MNVPTEDHCTVHYHTGVKLAEVQREGEPKVGLRIKIGKAKCKVALEGGGVYIRDQVPMERWPGGLKVRIKVDKVLIPDHQLASEVPLLETLDRKSVV